MSQAKPFAGYAIYNKTSSPVSLGNVISWTGVSKAVALGLDWKIQIKAFNGKYHDDFNFVGVSSLADDEEDNYDEADPLAIDKSLNLSIFSKANGKTVRLSTDAKKSDSDGYTWEFTVRDGINKKSVTLDFMSYNVPVTFEKKLVDISNNKIVDLQSHESYAFLPQNANRFKLVVGTANYVDKILEKISAELPQSFSLSQNFPNPFNPTTTIRFDVPRAGNIKLKIYNVLGQEVMTLAEGFFDTGRHSILWNGKDNSGHSVASGVYLYRLEGGGFSKVRKMTYLK